MGQNGEEDLSQAEPRDSFGVLVRSNSRLDQGEPWAIEGQLEGRRTSTDVCGIE